MICSHKGDIEVEGDLAEVLTDMTMLVYSLIAEAGVDRFMLDGILDRAEELMNEKGERKGDKIIGLSYQE